MRVWVLAGCVSVLVSLGAAFKIPDFISDLVDGKNNKRQDSFPAGVVEQILPATFALTFSVSLAQNLIELATATQGKKYLYEKMEYRTFHVFLWNLMDLKLNHELL